MALPIALPDSAEAARGIDIGFSDPLFHAPESDLRTESFDDSVAAGAGYARVTVSWSAVAPGEPADATDPGDPAYRFDRLDSLVREATERGLRVLFTLHMAPEWAEGEVQPGERYPALPGTQRPDPESLGEFAQALARRFGGDYVPASVGDPLAAGDPLPRVALFEAWNEPNLTGFLSPQWMKDRPFSPGMYRRMLNAVYRGVHTAQPSATVIAGATAPFGTGRSDQRRVRPLRFLRGLFCLSGRDRLRARNCAEPARFDMLSHHPISPEWEPRRGARHPDDVTIPEMSEVRRTLRAAERQGTVRPSVVGRPVWATEFWWETDPPITLYEAPSERRQARNIADGLRLLWEQRIPVAFLFQVRDDEAVTGPPRSGWGSGVLFADGREKLALRAVRFPFVADRRSGRWISIWTRAPRSGTLRILERGAGGVRERARVEVEAGEVIRRRLRLRGRGRLEARLGKERSIGWGVPGRRSAR